MEKGTSFEIGDWTAGCPSSDLFGGGGLVSSVSDLARFIRAPFQGEVYAQPATLTTILSTVPTKLSGPAVNGPLR
jgi:D-alanyl-D-alanine carboxypeptidase